jgi:hypothetical protein
VTLYDELVAAVAGLQRTPENYELHCHPDVMAVLRAAYPPPVIDPLFAGASALYGQVDILVRQGYPVGYWRLYRNGALLKDGRFTE